MQLYLYCLYTNAFFAINVSDQNLKKTMSTEFQILLIQVSLVLLLFSGIHGSLCTQESDILASRLLSKSNYEASPNISPSIAPEPMLPWQAPSPLMPFTYTGVPKLSGHCAFNFSAADSILRTTATDCWSSLAPFLANVVCCPQFDASLVVLVGQASSQSQSLALNVTHARHCLSDVEQILESQGASVKLLDICSVDPSNLTESSCPVIDVKEIESSLNTSSLLASCEKIDPTTECCNRVCQNAISAAAEVLAFSSSPVLSEKSTLISDCKSIILRWLSSKFDPSSSNRIIRVLSSCDINKSCPLVFPDIKNISKECGEVTSNPTSCCNAMNSYLSHLQQQSFVTNLQALNCATLLGKKLREANVTNNIFDLCRVNLKDFSLQVDEKESGCLLTSLPTDLTYDRTSGIGFICDLNDNVAAPWSSAYSGAASTCNKTAEIPELPKATSSQKSKGICMKDLVYALFFASSMAIQLLI